MSSERDLHTQQLLTLLHAQGIEVPEERIGLLLAVYCNQLRSSRALRDAVRRTDEPAHTFVVTKRLRAKKAATGASSG